ncbi:hypothetical protein BGW38_002958 [Lunasporangiospora selenospora]|uniref:Uncharacterized protein n=1 Tax=Lunasporangiospora selenospora TaxID=979761 RepID=A0A9P6FSH8_9FUNG|nr:hypothetical protein BGW38_002958 [Lunasporangiospora selenospora]
MHAGYELTQPRHFFEDYGIYALTLLYASKYGFQGPGIAPLSSSGSRSSDWWLDKSFRARVDAAISTIETNYFHGRITDSLMRKHSDVSTIDFSGLQSFVKRNTYSALDGGLYRTIARDGRCRWVCRDHYFKTYDQTIVGALRTVVHGVGGTIDVTLGTVRVLFISSSEAEAFYDVLVKARSVLELSIKLDWKLSGNDIRELRRAVTVAKVSRVVLERGLSDADNGTGVAWSFDDIAGLMFNGSLRSFRLKGFTDFNTTPIKILRRLDPILRKLELDIQVDPSTQGLSKFTQAMEYLQSVLSRVRVYCSSMHMVYSFFKENLSRFQVLKRLTLETNDLMLECVISKGAIVSTTSSVGSFAKSSPRDQELFCKLPLQHVYIAYLDLSSIDGVYLTSILKRNRLWPATASLEPIRSPGSNRPDPRRWKVILRRGGKGENAADVISTRRFEDDLDEFTTEMTMGNSLEDKDDAHLMSFVKTFGNTIDRLATSRGLTDKFVASLESSLANTSRPKLVFFHIDTDPLSSSGMRALHQIISKSTHISLSVQCKGMHDLYRSSKAIDLISAYSSRIRHLALDGRDSKTWMERLELVVPERKSLPGLRSLCLSSPRADSLAHESIQWISDMLSCFSGKRSSGKMEIKAVTEFQLEGFQLAPVEWNRILSVLDFTTLEILSFQDTNFSKSQFDRVVVRMTEIQETITLDELYLGGTRFLPTFNPKEPPQTHHRSIETLQRDLETKRDILQECAPGARLKLTHDSSQFISIAVGNSME